MLATLEESSNLRQAEQDRERDLVVSSSPIAKKMRATLEESSNPHQAEQDRELDLVVSSSPIANALLPRSAISSPRALAQSVTRQAMSRSSEASTSSLSVLRRPLELSSYERSRTTTLPASSSSLVRIRAMLSVSLPEACSRWARGRRIFRPLGRAWTLELLQMAIDNICALSYFATVIAIRRKKSVSAPRIVSES